MATSESPLDQLQRALRDLRSGVLDPTTVRHLQAGRAPAKLADLAALFGSKVLLPAETVVQAQINRECTLIEQSPFKPGDTIGWHYKVLRLHGGGFGLVYVCRQLGPEFYARSQNLVALKTPLPRHLANPELRAMFVTEAAHCVALPPHPNLVLAYGVEEHNRLPYLVLEYIPEARSLQDDILANATDWRTALRVGLGVARGLAFAGLVHGDLKPINILLGPEGTAKIADFGLALGADEPADEGVLAGTRGFFAPEMLADRPARTAATDLYACGVVLHVTATRHFPFPLQRPELNVTQPAPDSRETVADIPPAFAALILRCLERDPARRPGNFAALATELARLHRTLLGAEPAPEPAPDAPTRADALVNAAQSWINLGQPDKARAAARQALGLNARNWKAHTALGNVHFQAREYSAARASFMAAHEFDTEAIEPLLGAAKASRHLDQPDEARRWLNLAVKSCAARGQFAPLDSASLLIIELLAEKDAYHLVHRILADNPHAAITWNNRAVLLRRMDGPPEDILASAERALALNPAYAKAYVQKANALLELSRWVDALTSADHALSLDATLAGAYAAKFSALATLGRLAEARDCVDRGLSVLPGHELLLRARAKLNRA
jgi:tetratricopeptide (TPR) repeat protein